MVSVEKVNMSNRRVVISVVLFLSISALQLLSVSTRSNSRFYVPIEPARRLSSDAADQHQAARELSPNTYFPATDADIWQCSEYKRAGAYNRTFRDWQVATHATDEEILCAAHDASKRPMAPGTPSVAFLFMVVDEVPLEPLWRAFLRGHEEKYSLYVHSHNSNHTYPESSLFFGRQVPSKPLERFHISEAEAVRRVLAFALLDSGVANAWFALQSESSIPVRPFAFVYPYLMASQVSFVEAFYPWGWWREQWTRKPGAVRDGQMRKGEVWITVHRRHAGLIAGDFFVFNKFKTEWQPDGVACEIYIPTLMQLTDPLAIANRTVTYVNWNINGSHPVTLNASTVNPGVIRGIQEQRRNLDGMYTKTHTYGHDNQESCVYNGVANSSCWLFARKFAGQPEDVQALLSLGNTLGFGSPQLHDNVTTSVAGDS